MHSPSQTALARKLGLSQGTVSRALRNDRRIAESTRKRVLEAAEAMGYRPSVVISSFASKAHWTSRELRDCPLAYLWQPAEPGASRMNSLHALEREASRRGFRVTAINLREERDMRALARRLFNQGVQGLLLNYIRIDPTWFHRFPLENFAVISGEVHYEEERILTIRHQQRRAVLSVYRRMREYGYRRIGAALFSAENHPDDAARVAGFLGEQFHWEGRIDPSLLHVIEQGTVVDEERRRREFLAWVKTRRLDAVILPGLREYHWLRHEGLTPEQVGCAGIFMRSAESEGTPELAGFARDWEGIARVTMDNMEQLIRLRRYGFQDKPTLLSIPPTWEDGLSLPDRRKRAR